MWSQIIPQHKRNILIMRTSHVELINQQETSAVAEKPARRHVAGRSDGKMFVFELQMTLKLGMGLL